jgi:hypothetical protein
MMLYFSKIRKCVGLGHKFRLLTDQSAHRPNRWSNAGCDGTSRFWCGVGGCPSKVDSTNGIGTQVSKEGGPVADVAVLRTEENNVSTRKESSADGRPYIDQGLPNETEEG